MWMNKMARFFVILGFAFVLTPYATSAWGLLAGVLIALIFGNPYSGYTKKLSKPFLSIAIVGLGAGINLLVVAKAGSEGILSTAAAISATLFLGYLLQKIFRTDQGIAILINVGTAICGGSAIAAVSSAIHSKEEDISVALGVVFILNAIALVIFPDIGHFFHLTERQFGLWSALAIHDTSSVVGATMQYGREALQVGTTVKLVRALWIVPVTLLVAKMYSRSGQGKKTKISFPWFILGFICTSALVTWIPQLVPLGHQVEWLAKRLLVITLFTIGLNISRQTLKAVGIKPLLHGIILWLVVGVSNLIWVIFGAA